MNPCYELANPGEGEYVEKKSRFLGLVKPAHSEEEALSVIEAVKKQHYTARHHCSAYRLMSADGRITEKSSDDGEPSGTAGRPILDVLTGEHLVNVVCVVTRYFGGVLLGTGGLVRAYTQGAKEAVAAAELLQSRQGFSVTITCGYDDYGRVEYLLREQDVAIARTDYGAEVTVEAMVGVEERDRVTAALRESTAGRALVTFGEEKGFAVEKGTVIVLE